MTSLSTGADGAIWSPDGKNVVFVSTVYPDAKDDAANKERDEALKNSKVKAQVFTTLFYRHWNAFTEFKRSHLFVVSADADPTGLHNETTLPPRDLTPGDHDVPPFSRADRTCMRFRRTARNLPIRATSTRSKLPAQTTKSSSCR